MAEARTIGSLPVPNVQVLAETCNGGGEHVPERYLRTEASSDEVIASGDSNLAIPIIDLGKLLDPQSSEEECVKLGSACQNWGFFQLINNHGVADEMTGNLMSDIVEFFKQPLEAKKECSQQPDSLEGYGQAFVVSEDQKLDWADMLYLQVQPSESRDLRFWPTRPASFRHSLDVYASETAKLACRLLEFMAKGVGAEPSMLRGMFEGQGQLQGMRANYYPPCQQAADRVLGLSPHTDACGLTLLRQLNGDVQGLQVKKDGKWFAVDAMDGSFIVNVGDALEILSNGRFKSVEHRAVINPNKERISVAMFHYPCQDLILGPLPEFVKGDKVRYRSTSYKDFMMQYFAAKLDGRGHLERLKLE
uniref:Fe2OG dioxygenase domain-containing protein n=1 Tax=Arundo donax TaxID=35708 RepID=A0A0A9H3I8_ARUDO